MNKYNRIKALLNGDLELLEYLDSLKKNADKFNSLLSLLGIPENEESEETNFLDL